MKFKLYLIAVFFIFSSPAWGSGFFDFNGIDKAGKTAIGGAIGFTLDPDAFLLAPDLDFFLTNEMSIGPNVQFAISDRAILLTAAANFKYHFDIPESGFIQRFKPSVQCGLGLALLNIDTPGGGSNTDIGAIINLGFGFDIFLNEKFSLGNHLLFNILTPAVDDRFIFSWHFLTAKFYF